ncbi:MAG: glycosyltransferase family 4 protein [Anaerolineae bacterium]
MRVLVLTNFVPYPPNAGAKIRVSNQMKYISREHHVTLMCPVRPNSGQAEDAQKLVGEYCTEVIPVPWQKRSRIKFIPHLLRYVRAGDPIGWLMYYHQELVDALRHTTATQHFDVVSIHFSNMAPYIDAIAPNRECQTIFALHNVPYLQWRRMMLDERNIRQKLILFRDWLFMKRATLKYIRRYDKTTVVSELDRSILLKDAPGAKVVAVPTGMDTDALRPFGKPPGFRDLMLVGSMNYRPNVGAALYLGQEIFPLIKRRIPDARLFIVGANVPRDVRRLGEQVEGVNVTGYVDSVLPYYERCCLTLVPLRSGSGIRVKILESMSLGRPVVSTSLGCEGLQVTHDQDILIADTASDFAEQTIRLMTQPELWQRIADNGRRLIEEVYDWRVTGQRLVRAFEDG